MVRCKCKRPKWYSTLNMKTNKIHERCGICGGLSSYKRDKKNEI